MAHPYHHALSLVKKWGGTVDDFIAVHKWFDQSKEISADFRHRALRHHAEGIFMAETIFGQTLTLSTGRIIPTRWVGEQHVKEDLGFIPSGAWAGETAVDFPATEIPYAALTWDDPEVEMRQLSLEDVVEQLTYDFLSDTHGGWENNDGAYGEFCFDASARCIHLEFNERFTSSELFTHDF